jgi:hypothetical protein
MKRSRFNVSVPWGRGASEHRPGLFIKNYLLQHSSTSCADVFAALRDNLDRLNKFRIEIGGKPQFTKSRLTRYSSSAPFICDEFITKSFINPLILFNMKLHTLILTVSAVLP